MTASREHHVVLFGATGFTGGLVAEHLAEHAPPDMRWALAGRNLEKLEVVRERLGCDVPVLVADAADPVSLEAVARSTRVVATTVGPYLRLGEPLVAACAAAGTDYVDLTAEPEFVDDMYVRHHETAVRTGARLVHACGFDSIPQDLGVQFCVEHLPDDVPLRLRTTVRARSAVSGGTLDSTLSAMARGPQMLRAAARRRKAEPRPQGRRFRQRMLPFVDARHRVLALPMPSIDGPVVLRSAQAQESYGPKFAYGHYAGFRNPLVALGVALGMGALTVAAQVPPVRKRILAALPAGTGPSDEQRARGWFEVLVEGEGGGKRVIARLTGADPAYTETSRLLAESAMCLALDALPATSGQVTTAVAMGPVLRARLIEQGISFEVVEGA